MCIRDRSQTTHWEVVWLGGVAWRKSAGFSDRLDGTGPDKGSTISGEVVVGTDGVRYLRAAHNGNFLPITLQDGRQVLKQVAAPRPPPSRSPAPAAPEAPKLGSVLLTRHGSVKELVYPAVKELPVRTKHSQNNLSAQPSVPPLLATHN
eukprot:TRINITY_DN25578_c0_g1_i3.p1 TRINITY_DN25578_c0_g1~~TRINITY_DN25578_c0_g1_i3.p1  ORF type:complete len:149 (-),score=10.89 TRINITY_DN25578_c0_g1_i3:252-698(-)